MGVFSGFKRNEPEKSIIKRHHSLKGTKPEKIDEAEDRAKALLEDSAFQNWLFEKFRDDPADFTISLGVKTQGLHMIVLDLVKVSEQEYQTSQLSDRLFGNLRTMHIKDVDYVFLDGIDWNNFEFQEVYFKENTDRNYITVDPSLAGVDEEKIKHAQARAKALLSHGPEFEEMVNKNTNYNNEGQGKTTISLDIHTQRDYYLCLECIMFKGFFAFPGSREEIDLDDPERYTTHKIVSKHKNKIDIIPPNDFDWSINPKGKVFII
ncbi:hypothetical protein [Methanococcus maripaludis]|uniref:Uncharacterized protein n=1 Tax=Methanococcus maripaludis TaxID=39152 RepID=A0A7J9PHU5_METMI|nr:hypothetical protein [Methanococcus maripaludis]MBA2861099.1 hypothetical protein [Methanococcus maripaludis]